MCRKKNICQFHFEIMTPISIFTVIDLMQERDILTRKKRLTLISRYTSYFNFDVNTSKVGLYHIIIGAGVIELAGARAPKFLTAGAQGAHRIYGAPVKKFKRLMKKPNIQQRKCSACHPLATDTLPLIIHKQLC